MPARRAWPPRPQPNPGRGRRLAASLVWLWYRHGHGDEGLDFIQRAIDRAPDDRSTVQAQLLVSAAALAQVCGQFRRIVDYAQRSLEVGTLNHDDRIRGRCLFLLAAVQFYLDSDAAWELCAQALACAAAAGDAFTEDATLVIQGSIPSTRDRFGTALPLLQEGAERCLRRGDRTFAALALNDQDDIAVATGDVARADDLATRALEIAQPWATTSRSACRRATWPTSRDWPATSTVRCGSSSRWFVPSRVRTSIVDSLDALARLACRAESSAEAVRLLAPATPPVPRWATRALRSTSPATTPPWLACVPRWVARPSRMPGPRAQASRSTTSSRTPAGRGGRELDRRRGWASLTPTELDVVRLVAEGLTNPEIGARLFISRATVKPHLSHVYAKLDVSNRTELAAVASARSGRGGQSPATGSS